MSDHVEFTAGVQQEGMRLDVAVSEAVVDLSRTQARALIDSGQVRVAGRTGKPSYRLMEGDVVTVTVDRPPALSAIPEDIPLTIVYRDADMVVIDKPAGMVVHPAPGHSGGTIANALMGMFPEAQGVGGAERPGIVHRLDKDTSGLMLAALSPAGQSSLQAQIADRTAERRYLALVAGHPRSKEGVIDVTIGRDPRDRKRMAVHGIAAREARTRYQVLREMPGFSLVEAKLDTGRTHQIRVHCAAIGHPIAGDSVYGGPALPGLHRQFLHAYRLAVRSPRTGEQLTFESDLPPDLNLVLGQLERDTGET